MPKMQNVPLWGRKQDLAIALCMNNLPVSCALTHKYCEYSKQIFTFFEPTITFKAGFNYLKIHT